MEGAANGVEEWGSVSARLTTLALGASAWTFGARIGETEIRFADAPGDPGDVEVFRAGGWAGFETRTIDPGYHAGAGIRVDRIQSDFGPDGGSWGPWIRVESVAPLVEVVGVTPCLEAEARFGDVEYRRARARGSVRGRFGPVHAALVADAAIVSRAAPLDAAPDLGEDGLTPGLRSGERRGRARAVLGVDLAALAAFHATLRLRVRGGVVADETRVEQGILYSGESLRAGGARLSALWWTPFGQVEVGGEGSTLGDRRAIVVLGTWF